MNKKIEWCLKQKSGIEIIEPNDNLMKAYFIKAENSLKAISNEKGNIEWEMTAAYYSMYFSIYALLLKCGIKSGIHSCTIEILKEFFKDYFGNEDITLLENANRLRQSIQYYIPEEEDINEAKKIILKANDFFLKCKELSIFIDFVSLRKNILHKTQNQKV